MNTKHGEISNDVMEKYLEKLVNRIFKLLPLKEEDNPTVEAYLDSLLNELIGGESLMIEFKENPDYLSVIFSLEGVRYLDEMKVYKREIFKCINTIKKISDEI